MSDTPPKEVHLTLTEQGANMLLSCIDAAVKAGGLNAAVQLLPLAIDIKSQLTPPTQ